MAVPPRGGYGDNITATAGSKVSRIKSRVSATWPVHGRGKKTVLMARHVLSLMLMVEGLGVGQL